LHISNVHCSTSTSIACSAGVVSSADEATNTSIET
jgi:hypothetical protein